MLIKNAPIPNIKKENNTIIKLKKITIIYGIKDRKLIIFEKYLININLDI